ncbi:peptidylprolyl isomerase [Chitinasiproducens palmae]|uniref:peptidylprolyl isomerase n=1 Tax=Chitinasiproducens palmae TaxID=1770053 RepID=A0A1H2PVY8_9BURK|nr:peptidylprolyl isomerase [Chitinasiproducens palmae]SDV51464.1 peptidyl-prolyl cis-trans isomerase C [Chitinasiproducens palmae]
MNQRLSRAALALTALVVAHGASAQNVAVVNGTPIPVTQQDVMLQAVAQGKPATPEMRQQVREELINREVLYQEAARQGVLNRPAVRAQVALAQQSIAIRALLEDFVKTHTPSDQALKAKYDQLVAGVDSKEYHLHHILVDSEAQAKQLIAEIKGGASFEELAKKFSKDPGSGKNGGDLDWAPLQGYVPEFSAAAAKLGKGQTTDAPVHTQFGWHIIRVDDVRQAQLPSFEDVKPQLQQQEVAEALSQYQAQLRQKAKIQ